jgi:molybdopterin/thiamine biosynthesis adenylyltransferase/rhodanese-related sulfurtransferase
MAPKKKRTRNRPGPRTVDPVPHRKPVFDAAPLDRGDTKPGEIPRLGREEATRYLRHLVLPEVTLAGQLALKRSSVLLVGAGGLGTPAALYLCAAGVGRLGIVDDDVVEETNLQRQVLFATPDIGRPKLEAATERLNALNPNVDVVPHPVRLTSDNAVHVISGYDVVVDGSDNFPTRYLVNDTCAALGKPVVYGGASRFEGQASVFVYGDGPCYRCLYPEPPPSGTVPNCAEAGVLGAVPGIVGAIQAVETIKVIVGSGVVLSGRLLVFDALKMEFRELSVPRDPACRTCAKRRRAISRPPQREDGATSLGEYDGSATPEIGPRELRERLDRDAGTLLIDVREPDEWHLCRIGGVLIPLSELPSRLGEIDRSREIVVYCRTGIRSAAAVAYLRWAGYERVWNLRGGIHAWADEIDPTIPKY